MKKLNVAVVGLSFGLEFVPIYLEHPDVEKVYLVDTDASLLHVAQNRMESRKRTVHAKSRKFWMTQTLTRCTLYRPPATHDRSQFEC